ncbi:hypothetical protein [Francisella philomiragia]|uniref:hypothetical protein n=1 Tax=Francisella philomiragia TaxID=28110 RepID=UPI0019086CBC|nr:hypothetical protein [Francisella philomiragia]MBK2268300.1 hypothetical protein [Francisella philomiragia]MBK2279705.1 hypothetical protein [Francisella philomiragia]MBK2287611.1 hypothetical protein [Francisella philomiragia]MBK2289590.1 hypothetical protein [Francisella philomiragia]MBK2291488.1 hypothetical protein [Francisella philomiragia]
MSSFTINLIKSIAVTSVVKDPNQSSQALMYGLILSMMTIAYPIASLLSYSY